MRSATTPGQRRRPLVRDLAFGLLFLTAVWAPRSASGNELLRQGPMLNPNAMRNANPLGEGIAMLTSLATRLQDHGYKALIQAVNLPKGQVEVIETGVNGANVQLAAVPCDPVDGAVCLLSLKVTFSDARQVVNDAFCAQITKTLSLARVIPVIGQDGRKAANLVYTLMYQGDPDIRLVETALRMFGADIDRYRNGYRDAMNDAAR